jgi:hypothetical protein
MKSIPYSTVVRSLMAAAATAFFAHSANAQGPALITHSFCQDGFEEGAFVTGKFEGTDWDGDGQLSSFDGEVSGFAMSFSGNSLVGAFGLGLGDLFGLVYDIGSVGIGDGIALDIEGIGAVDTVGFEYSYVTGQGPTGTDGGYVTGPGGGVSASANLALIDAHCAPVPDGGATLGLLALSCGALLLRKRS